MKKLFLIPFLLLAGCFDLTQYISFNDKGRTLVSLRLTMPSSLLEGEVTESDGLMEKFAELTNKLSMETAGDSNVTAQTLTVSNSASFGVELLQTAPKHYLAANSRPDTFFPQKESYGFSLPMGDGFKESVGSSGDLTVASAFFKYRILLSKASLPRPLEKVRFSSPRGETALAVAEHDRFYLIEVPILPLMEGAQKIEFHFESK